jgi:hypothetical protein
MRHGLHHKTLLSFLSRNSPSHVRPYARAQTASLQTACFFFGLVLAIALIQSSVLCSSGTLTGFGWAVLVSLSGGFFMAVSQWSALMRSPLPEPVTWRRAIAAGALLSVSLYLLGLALSASPHDPLMLLALSFIPWSRSLWRQAFAGDGFSRSRDRLNSMLTLAAVVVFLYPEWKTLIQQAKLTLIPDLPSASVFARVLKLMEFSATAPRSNALLSALLFGAASSLQRPQDRSIPTLIFWTIPAAIAALLLCSAGWVALHLIGNRASVFGYLHDPHISKLWSLAPALLVGVLLFAVRPRLHARAAFRIGRESTQRWQFLGLCSGAVAGLLMLTSAQTGHLDLVLVALLLMAHWLTRSSHNSDQDRIQFAQTLRAVPAERNIELTANAGQ